MPAAPKAPAKKRASRTTKPAHPLEHLVPPKVKADEYVSRTVNGHQDIDLLRYARKVSKHVLLSGPTGLGKSHCVEAYCATDGIPLVVIEAKDGIDPNTFFGGYVPQEDGNGFKWVYSDVVEVMRKRDGLPDGGVLFIDECNFMRPRVSATFHRVMREGKFSILERGNETIECSPNLQIVAAYNDGYEGTYPLNQAFRNRFAIKLEVDYDPDVEQHLLCMPVMLEIADRLRSGDAIETPVSTNMLAEFEELAIDLGLDFAITNFLAAFESVEKQATKEVLALFDQRLRKELQELEALSGE